MLRWFALRLACLVRRVYQNRSDSINPAASQSIPPQRRQEELQRLDLDAPFDARPVLAADDYGTPDEPFLGERAQAAEVFLLDAAGRLRFYRDAVVEDEVHLVAGPGAPAGERRARPAVVDPGAQLQEHVVFEEGAEVG